MMRSIDIQKALAPDPVIDEMVDEPAAWSAWKKHGRAHLPHERDEEAVEEVIEVRDRLKQALDDLAHGQQDTDMHGQPSYATRDESSREPDTSH